MKIGAILKVGGASYFETMNDETKTISARRCEVQGTYGGKLNETDFLKILVHKRKCMLCVGSFNLPRCLCQQRKPCLKISHKVMKPLRLTFLQVTSNLPTHRLTSVPQSLDLLGSLNLPRPSGIWLWSIVVMTWQSHLMLLMITVSLHHGSHS